MACRTENEGGRVSRASLVGWTCKKCHATGPSRNAGMALREHDAQRPSCRKPRIEVGCRDTTLTRREEDNFYMPVQHRRIEHPLNLALTYTFTKLEPETRELLAGFAKAFPGCRIGRHLEGLGIADSLGFSGSLKRNRTF
jgi:hypothetical protein